MVKERRFRYLYFLLWKKISGKTLGVFAFEKAGCEKAVDNLLANWRIVYSDNIIFSYLTQLIDIGNFSSAKKGKAYGEDIATVYELVIPYGLRKTRIRRVA